MIDRVIYRVMAGLLIGASALFTSVAWGLSAEELATSLAAGDKLVLIDVRSRASYTHEHIPGAISIPASLLLRKRRLPVFPNVVIYGDGIHGGATQVARDALATRLGVESQVLDGGFPAWEGYVRTSTKGGGLFDEIIDYISYEELGTIQKGNSDLVLIDLRRPGKADRANGETKTSTDLRLHFPGCRVLAPGRSRWTEYARGEFESSALMSPKALSPSVLYVLIDDGDGRMAEAMARRMRGNGIKRFAVLVGGEVAIQTKGAESTTTSTRKFE